jgi:hypothetical protein
MASGRPGRGRPNSTDWLVIGFVGIAILLFGILRPASGWLPSATTYGTDWVEVGIAVLGGIIFGLGISKWYDNRPGGPAARRRPPTRDLGGVRDLPTFSVYKPDGKRPPRK